MRALVKEQKRAIIGMRDMRNEKRDASEELRIARRDLDDSELTIIRDLEWDKESKKWTILINIDFSYKVKKKELCNTNWYILIDDNYPKGHISIYPSRENGIEDTYPHQSYNSSNTDKKWRSGNVCLDTQNKVINRMINISEPSNATERLKWHCDRLKMWIVLASEDRLLEKGDYFELPVFPSSQDIIFAFDENENTFFKWKYFFNSYGNVELYKKSNLYLTANFYKKNNRPLQKNNWGNIVDTCEMEDGIWILINKIPLHKEWSVIEDWGQLDDLLKLSGINLLEILLDKARGLRDGKSHLMIIGFPIPNKCGDEYVNIHWQAIKMPILTHSDKLVKNKGFMDKNKKYVLNDILKVVNKDRRLDWVRSENWNEKDFYSRGMLSENLMKNKIMLIGCGSLGSNITEYLVRGGIKNIALVDNEKFSSGNLVRHTLGIGSLDKSKVNELKERLSLINPKLCIDAKTLKFEKALLNGNYSIIIDCTANNELLYDLEEIKTNDKLIYFNISFSKGAKVLFIYGCLLKEFKASSFLSKLENYREIYPHENIELPREGIGCWHPVFPAKMYEISLMSSIAVNYIENYLSQQIFKEDFTSYETIYKDKDLMGVKKVSDE